jgi:hypothetical protein
MVFSARRSSLPADQGIASLPAAVRNDNVLGLSMDFVKSLENGRQRMGRRQQWDDIPEEHRDDIRSRPGTGQETLPLRMLYLFVPHISTRKTLRLMHTYHCATLMTGPLFIFIFNEIHDTDFLYANQIFQYA